MKKLIAFLIITCIFVLKVSAQFEYERANSTLRATHIAAKAVTGESFNWERLTIPLRVYYNLNTQRMIVFSSELQIIDHQPLKIYNGSDYTLYYAMATDSDYIRHEFNLYLYKSGLIVVKFAYSDFEIKYILVKDE